LATGRDEGARIADDVIGSERQHQSCAKAAPSAIAGPESRRIGSSSTSASAPVSASCYSTMKR
jgi:hypothetical protein